MADSVNEYLMYQKDQLYDGKLSTGSDLTPSYFDDPYFKSRESAQRYSDWKDNITPNSRRNRGTPNLFINGYFYSQIYVEPNSEGFMVDSRSDKISSFKAKYGEDMFGLDAEYKMEYAPIVLNKLMPKFFSVANAGQVNYNPV